VESHAIIYHAPRTADTLATPSTQTFRLPTVSVEVTSAGDDRPVVVLPGAPAALAGRLARAGFATVTFTARGPGDLDVVLEALERGALGLRAERYGLVEGAADGSIVITRVAAGTRSPGTTLGAAPPDRAAAAVVQWLTRHLV
jgi:hypothetical protein